MGHSVKALVGHWQKNKDPYWYAKKKTTGQAELAKEIKAVKEREEELMLEALGMKKAKKKQTTDFGKRLQQYEVAGLLKRREKEDGEQNEDEDLGPRGLGFRRTAAPLTATATHEVLEGVGISETKPPDKPPEVQSSGLNAAAVEREHSKKKRKKDKLERKEAKKRKKETAKSPKRSKDRDNTPPPTDRPAAPARKHSLRMHDEQRRSRSPRSRHRHRHRHRQRV